MNEGAVESTFCGYIAIVGRPNVGKSTLLNQILEQKISITSKKAQTTRHQILGVKTEGDYQFIYVDTPGIHRGETKALNQVLNQSSSTALKDADIIVLVVEALKWTDTDAYVLEQIKASKAPKILALNKIDQVKDKTRLLPYIEKVAALCDFDSVIPMSAESGEQVEALEKELAKRLPQGLHMFPEDQVTDRSVRFMAAEIIREKIMRQMGDEIPYNVAVEIEKFKHEGGILRINGLIWVEREGQKKIVIGTAGERLKRIGTDARKDIEQLLDTKVMLELWVKVKSGWSDNLRALKSLGYDETD
ncbi:MAG: GTPase Era [Hahellaceae bacterium]|jgi:GTP-binding protein Era|nr:GTPase Era [Hahellaceae bacterium]